ncbi:pseudouridine synthase [Helicobacter sp. MIT 99-5507]|uniref:pseudouridine synthase n=1 Tax=Helicobacter sp. MIT 99-5507 TaxID=152489 RepID=UPI000E1F9804|nr:pseudouridine synthase [Helicobacter sp. MIT 99-5507]RDU57541.1 rRNA pseudouridine synthase [Helicobacter sp. MIT 99-5507]
MRLNKWISHNTDFSRRKADELIKDGKVKLNHKVATFGDIITKEKVFINGREIRPKDSTKYSVIVYHKPKNELVSKSDDRDRRVIYDTLDSKFRNYIPVGRLDFASSGLLLLTDSKDIATKLMTSNLVRIYNLKINGKINQKVIDAMNDGLSLSDASAGAHKYSKIKSMDFAPFSFFEITRETKSWSKIKVGIIEGKNRELRRFFAYFGLDVIDLKRVSYGFVELNALPIGKSRYLSRKDYNKLRAFLKESK